MQFHRVKLIQNVHLNFLQCLHLIAAQGKDEISLKSCSYFASFTNVNLYTFYYRIWGQFLAFVLTSKNNTPNDNKAEYLSLQNIKAGCSDTLT